MLISDYLSKYREAILALPPDALQFRDKVLTSNLLMTRSGDQEMFYAPHNEVVNPAAKVVIIGITPGWTQMRIALEAARKGLQAGLTDEAVCKLAKEAAGFAGTMRVNLIDMLDKLELHNYLGIGTCADLFGECRALLNTTSLLRFPVFSGGRNYNGSHPDLPAHPFLDQTALSLLHAELSVMNRPLLIPLGNKVEQVLQPLAADGLLDGERCLWGFPHPSGANGHRLVQFARHKERMRKQIQALGG
ncbi:hypothetical protein [Paenibacillus piscarius]|uniref:hypothetical protein n=1 Tax=Paenibacillus piscarius TaxID=1089681 RepID=UPI001EE803BE|nr:hypothetical protein [Paenibacillus piscarius]